MPIRDMLLPPLGEDQGSGLSAYGSTTAAPLGSHGKREMSSSSLLTDSSEPAALIAMSRCSSSSVTSSDSSPDMELRKLVPKSHGMPPREVCDVISDMGFSSDEEIGGHDVKQNLDLTETHFVWKLVKGNYKVFISGFIWYVSYMIMAIFGGTVAFMHFPRTNLPYPHTLPDYGYDVIPQWCPAIPHVPHGNVQSFILIILYTIIWSGICVRWTRDGKLILQQLLHLNSLVFLTRTTTVSVTGLPQPNPRCISVQAFPVTYEQAWEFVIGRGFPPHACGDLIYSGHVGCTLICMTIMHRHGFLSNMKARMTVWSLAFLGIYATLSCRSHYTVDVVLACYFIFFLREFYFLRSDGVINGPFAKWIQWLERC